MENKWSGEQKGRRKNKENNATKVHTKKQMIQMLDRHNEWCWLSSCPYSLPLIVPDSLSSALVGQHACSSSLSFSLSKESMSQRIQTCTQADLHGSNIIEELKSNKYSGIAKKGCWWWRWWRRRGRWWRGCEQKTITNPEIEEKIMMSRHWSTRRWKSIRK